MEKAPVGTDTVEVNTKGVFDPIVVTFNDQPLRENFDLGEYVVGSDPMPLEIKIVNRSGYPVNNILLEFVDKSVSEYSFAPNEEGKKEFPGLEGTCPKNAPLESGEECMINFQFFAQKVAQISQSLRIKFNNIIAPEDQTFGLTIFSGAPASLIFTSEKQDYIFGEEVGFAKRPVIERNIQPEEQNNIQNLTIKNTGDLKARNLIKSLTQNCAPKTGSCPNALNSAFKVLSYDCPETLLSKETCNAQIEFNYKNQGDEPSYQRVDYEAEFKIDYDLNPQGDRGALSARFKSIATDIQAIFEGLPSGVNFSSSLVVGNSETKNFRVQNNGFREGYLRKILFFDNSRSAKKFECYKTDAAQTNVTCYDSSGITPTQKEFPFSLTSSSGCLSIFDTNGDDQQNTETPLDQGCDFSLTYSPSVELKEGEINFYNLIPINNTTQEDVRDTYIVSNDVFYTASASGLARTTDGGNTFTTLHTTTGQNPVSKVIERNNQIYMAIDDDGLYISDKDDINFTRVFNTSGTFGSSSITDLVVTTDTIYFSLNDGSVFEADVPSNLTNFSSTQINFPNPPPTSINTLYLNGDDLYVGTDGQTYKMDISTETSFSALPQFPGSLLDLIVEGARVYALNFNGLWISTNGGQTFLPLQSNIPMGINVTSFTVNSGNLYLGTSDGHGLYIAKNFDPNAQNNFKVFNFNQGFGVQFSTAVYKVEVVAGKIYASTDNPGLIVGVDSSMFNYTIGYEYDARHLNNEKIMAHLGQTHPIDLSEASISLSAGYVPAAKVGPAEFTVDPLSSYENEDDPPPTLGSMPNTIVAPDYNPGQNITSIDLASLNLNDDFWKKACPYELDLAGSPRPLAATLLYGMNPPQSLPIFIVPSGSNSSDTTNGSSRIIENELTSANIITANGSPFPTSMNSIQIRFDDCHKARWIQLGELPMELEAYHERQRLRFSLSNLIGSNFQSSANNIRIKMGDDLYTASDLSGKADPSDYPDHGLSDTTNYQYSIYQDIHFQNCAGTLSNAQNNCELVMDFSPIFRGNESNTKLDVFDSDMVNYKTIEILYEDGSYLADGEDDTSTTPITKKAYIFIKASLIAAGKLTRPRSIKDPLSMNVSGTHTYQILRFANAGTSDIPWIRSTYNHLFNLSSNGGNDSITPFNNASDVSFLKALGSNFGLNNWSFLNAYYNIEPVSFVSQLMSTTADHDCMNIIDFAPRDVDPASLTTLNQSIFESLSYWQNKTITPLPPGETCELLLKYQVTDAQRFVDFLTINYGMAATDADLSYDFKYKDMSSATSKDGELMRGAASKDLLDGIDWNSKQASYLFENPANVYISRLASGGDINRFPLSYYNNQAIDINGDGQRDDCELQDPDDPQSPLNCLGKLVTMSGSNLGHIKSNSSNNFVWSNNYVERSYDARIKYIPNSDGERFNGQVSHRSPIQTTIVGVEPYFNTSIVRCDKVSLGALGNPALDITQVNGYNSLDFINQRVSFAAVPSSGNYVLSHREWDVDEEEISTPANYHLAAGIQDTNGPYFLPSIRSNIAFFDHSTSASACNSSTHEADYIVYLGEFDTGNAYDVALDIINSSGSMGVIQNSNLVVNGSDFSISTDTPNGFDESSGSYKIFLKNADSFNFGLDESIMSDIIRFKLKFDPTTTGNHIAYLDYEVNTLIPLDETESFDLTPEDMPDLIDGTKDTVKYNIRVLVLASAVAKTDQPTLKISTKNYTPDNNGAWDGSFTDLNLDLAKSSNQQYIYDPVTIASVRDANQPDKVKIKVEKIPGSVTADFLSGDRVYTYFRNSLDTPQILDKIYKAQNDGGAGDLTSSLTDSNPVSQCSVLENSFSSTSSINSESAASIPDQNGTDECTIEFNYNAYKLSSNTTTYLVIAHTRGDDGGFDKSVVEHIIPIISYPIDPAILEVKYANFRELVYLGGILGERDLFIYNMGDFTIDSLDANGEYIVEGTITVNNVVNEAAKFVNLLGVDSDGDGSIDQANLQGNMGIFNSDGDIELVKNNLKLTIPFACYFGEGSNGTYTVHNSIASIPGGSKTNPGTCSDIKIELTLTAADISPKQPTPSANVLSGYGQDGKLPFGTDADLADVAFKLPFLAFNNIVPREIYIAFTYSAIAPQVGVNYQLISSTSSLVQIDAIANEEGIGVNKAVRLCLFNESNSTEICSDSTNGEFDFSVGQSGIQAGQKYSPRLYVIKELSGAPGVEDWTVPSLAGYGVDHFITTPRNQLNSSQEFVVPPVGFAYDHARKNIIRTADYGNASALDYDSIKQTCAQETVSIGSSNIGLKLMKRAEWQSFLIERQNSGVSMTNYNSALPVFDNPIPLYSGTPSSNYQDKITYRAASGNSASCYPTTLSSATSPDGDTGWIEYNCLLYNLRPSEIWCYGDI